MKRALFVLLGLSGLSLGACSDSSNPKPAEPNRALTQAVHAPLDQAKALENQMQEQVDANRERIDAATQ